MLGSPALALDGQVGIHDPSTIVQCDGKFYTWGTGGRGLVSADGWTWERGSSYGGGGLAPDVIRLGDRYYLYYAVARGQPRAEVHMTSNKTLDPKSPDYKWEDGGVVASSDGIEDCNAIDPGLFLDPERRAAVADVRLLLRLHPPCRARPEDGQAITPGPPPPRDLAVNCEASIMIYRDGWYYLLATHGSCCAGDSGYNIRVGRAKKVTGPFLDQDGIDMIQGGGKLFLGSEGRMIGPGHFGLLDLGEGVQKFSCHYEADLDRGGASVHGHPAAALARRLAGRRREREGRDLPDRIRAHGHGAGTGGGGRARRRPAARGLRGRRRPGRGGRSRRPAAARDRSAAPAG